MHYRQHPNLAKDEGFTAFQNHKNNKSRIVKEIMQELDAQCFPRLCIQEIKNHIRTNKIIHPSTEGGNVVIIKQEA